MDIINQQTNHDKREQITSIKRKETNGSDSACKGTAPKEIECHKSKDVFR